MHSDTQRKHKCNFFFKIALFAGGKWTYSPLRYKVLPLLLPLKSSDNYVHSTARNKNYRYASLNDGDMF